MAYELIETIEVGSGGAASISFTSIPQDGVDLLLMVSARTDRNVAADVLGAQFNGDTTVGNYGVRSLGGDGAAVSSLTAPVFWLSYTSDNSNTASTFGNGAMRISNYTSSSAKSYSADGVSENNATTAYHGIVAGYWSGTSAITSIDVFPIFGTNLVQYSTASLYKIY